MGYNRMVEALRNDSKAPVKRNLFQRRFQRVNVNLLGRFMLEDFREYPCHVTEMSPGDASLITPIKGRLGENIVVYIEQLGRVEGKVVRYREGGFAITLNGSSRKRDKLADQLTWLANRHLLDNADDRRHERLYVDNFKTHVVLPNGESMPARVLDMSLSGAAVDIGRTLDEGTLVMLGNVRGRVVRNLGKGIALEFLATQSSAEAAHQAVMHI